MASPKLYVEQLMKHRIFAAALVAASAWVAGPTATAATIVVREAPPALRVETVPAPRPGYQWVNGHWDWRGNHWVWVGGTFLRERPGYVYSAPVWVERDGRWERREARWARHDDDRDGIPNGADRHPENPVRP
jgi:hypothetical protein